MKDSYKLGWTWNPFKQRFEHQHKDGYLIFTDMESLTDPFNIDSFNSVFRSSIFNTKEKLKEV